MEYIVITWPDIQDLMEQDWFENECHLINDENGIEKYGSSAYFVPKYRLEEIVNK